jgi:hypothetical protein
VRYTSPSCELSLAHRLGSRIETLVRDHVETRWFDSTNFRGADLTQFLLPFTRLRCLILLPTSEEIVTIYRVLPPPLHLPGTLHELRLMASVVNISDGLDRWLADECPALRRLALCVGEAVDAQCLNGVCRRLERLELHFYRFPATDRYHPADSWPGEGAILLTSSSDTPFRAPALVSLKLLSVRRAPTVRATLSIATFLQWILADLAKSCAQLKELRVNILPSDHQTTPALGQWQLDGSLLPVCLEQLDLWDTSIDDEALKALAEEGKLRELTLRDCARISPRGVCAVVTKCRELRRLTVDCRQSPLDPTLLFRSVCECLDATRGAAGRRPDATHPPLLFADGGEDASMHPWVVRVLPRWQVEIFGMANTTSERVRYELWKHAAGQWEGPN